MRLLFFAAVVDQIVQVVPLLIMLLLLCAGISTVLVGSYIHTHLGTLNRGRNHTLQLLLDWPVEQPGSSDPSVLQQFICAQDFVQSSAIIGLGLGLIVMVIGTEILSWTITTTWYAASTWLVMAAVFLSYLLGYGFGYLYGVWRLRRQSARGVTYADLQARRLADYRSPAFPLAVTALIVGVILLTVLLAPYLGRQVPLELMNGTKLELSRWVFWAVPAGMVLTLLTAERIMALIAGLPRLFVTSQPHTAQRADNLLRALTIGTLQGYELFVIAALAIAQNEFIVSSFWQSGFWQLGSRPYSAVLDLEFGLATLVGALSFFSPLLYGRLGGRISGWPWRRAATP